MTDTPPPAPLQPTRLGGEKRDAAILRERDGRIDSAKTRARMTSSGNVTLRYDDLVSLLADFTSLRESVADLSTKVYQPGVFKCAKCNFQLVQKTLNTNTGSVTARDAVGEKCPNDGSPMWRVSYQEDNAQAWEWGEKQFDRAVAAEARVATLEAPWPR